MRRRTMLAGLALGIGGAAVAGYGAAMERDAWRATKKRGGFLLFLALIACAIVLPFLGGRNLTRGYPEGQSPPVFTSILLIVGGWIFGLIAASVLAAYEMTGQFSNMGIIVVASAGVGLLYGASQKPRRLHTFEIADRNEHFLEQFGFEELDGTEVTHMDGEGNPLRLTERNDESIVFLAVGRRNRRAYIRLSPEGRMLGYTGVIAITDPRQYRDPSGQPVVT